MRLGLICLVLAVFTAGCISSTQDAGTGGVVTSITSKPSVTSTTGKPSLTTQTTIKPTTTTIEAGGGTPSTTSTLKRPSNISSCMTLEEGTYRDQCLYDIAGRDKNIDLCDSIDGKNTELKCRARLLEKQEYCDRIDTLTDKDWCYRMMAFRWNNLKYCKLIFYQDIKDKCIWDFLKDKKADPFECFQIIDARYKDECIFYHIGLDRINPRLCNLIVNETLEVECNNTYIPD